MTGAGTERPPSRGENAAAEANPRRVYEKVIALLREGSGVKERLYQS